MRILVKSLFFVAFLLCSFGVASANTLVVNCTIVSGPTELNANVLCPQFNVAGTLQSVQITVSGSITGSITLTNNASTTQTGSGTTSSSFNVGALTGFSFVNPVFSASYTTGTRTLSAGQTLTVVGLSASGSGDLGTNSSSLAPYTGAGNFNIGVSTATLFSAQGSGGFFMGSEAENASATAVVTYTFLPPTNTPTNTPTGTLTPPTNTPTNTPTSTPTNTPTSTPTSTPTNTPTSTPTNTPIPVAVVPTLNEPGMLIFGLLIAAAGLLLLVRRR